MSTLPRFACCHLPSVVECVAYIFPFTLADLKQLYDVTCARNEEIVMPAEQVGLVRDNYLWKVSRYTSH